MIVELQFNVFKIKDEGNFSTEGSMRCLFLVVSFLLTVSSWATEYIVATNGSDANPGTLARPCKTIQCALNKAKIPGDIVSVRAGSYRGSVTLKYPGVQGKPITLRSYPGERAVIDQGPDLETTKSSGLQVAIKHVDGLLKPIGWLVVENLDIARGYNGININNAYDVVIRKCTIRNSWNQGILGNGLRVTITQNTIASNGYMFGTDENLRSIYTHGVYMYGTYIKITNNIIRSNNGFGVHAAGSYYPKWHAGPSYAYARNWIIANNTFAFQRNRGGLAIWQAGATDNTIINNLFYDNSNQMNAPNGIEFLGAGSGNILRNNLFYSSKSRLAISESRSGSYTPRDAPSANLLQINPRFRNASAYDFHLLSGSPAINEGLKYPGLSVDFGGSFRDTVPDIGAYEFRSESGSTPLAPQQLSIK